MDLQVIQELEEKGLFENALKIIDNVPKLTPEIVLMRLRLLSILDRYDLVASQLNQLYTNYSNSDDLSIVNGIASIQMEYLLNNSKLDECDNVIIDVNKHIVNKREPRSRSDKLWFGRLLLAKGECYQMKGDFKKSKKQLEQSYKLFKELPSARDQYVFHKRIGTLYRHQGDLDKALKHYNASLGIAEKQNNHFDMAGAYNNIGIVHARIGVLDKAEKFFEKSRKNYEKSGSQKILSNIYNNLGNIAKAKGDVILAEQYYNLGINNAKDHNDKNMLVTIYVNLGMLQLDQGNINQAHDTYKFALPIMKEIGTLDEQSKMLNNLGLIYKRQGKFKQALDSFQESLRIKSKLQNQEHLATTHQNIGLILLQRGELETAMYHFEINLTIWTERKNDLEIAKTRQYIGLVHLTRNELDEATDMLLKAYKTILKNNNPISVAEILYYVILLNIEKGDEINRDKYFEELQKLDSTVNYKVIKTRKLLLEAIIKQSEPRIAEKVKAHSILEQVLENELVDHEITTNAKLNLCQFLLIEYKTAQDKEVKAEIETILQKLYDIARETSSHPLMIENLILQARLAIIDVKIEEAGEHLILAEEIAEQKGLDQYKIKVSYAREQLRNDLQKYGKMKADYSRSKGMGEMEILDYINEIAKMKKSENEGKDEKSV